MTTLEDDVEVHPLAFVTAKEYVPAARSRTVVLMPVPVVVIPPGFLVKVHVPDDGNPLSATLPVATEHDGWVIVPTTGGVGVTGCELIITFEEGDEIQPSVLVTVKVYVPAARPDKVVLTPLPVVVIFPGLRVSVHVPLDGRALNITLPVATAQVGCVIVPTTGAFGVSGCALIITFDDDAETHPTELVTV
jgi:hypothetical protein